MKTYIIGPKPASPADAEIVTADARGARAAVTFPCLNTNNCNREKKDESNTLSSVHRKTAFALKRNVLLMMERHGLEKIGFLTLTFKRHVVEYKVAQKALHSLMTGVLKPRYPEYITVMERMASNRIHYHLLVVLAEDIRTGFDFAAVKTGDYQTASPYLRREWAFWRLTAPKYGFGRTELLPIKKTAPVVARYIGKYLAKHIGKRLPEDKGARLVRYSKGANRVGVRFDWVTPGASMWRGKLAAFCKMFRLTSDNHKQALKEWFGSNWIFQLRPVIESIKLPEYHTDAEAKQSLRMAWIVASNERDRHCKGKRKNERKNVASQSVYADTYPAQPAASWGSWLERTIKED